MTRLIAFALLLASLPARALTLDAPGDLGPQAGSQSVMLGGGLGVQLTKFDGRPMGETHGTAVDAQYLYHLAPHWAVGGEFAAQNFRKLGYLDGATRNTQRASFLTGQALARFVPFPEGQFWPYLTAGAGLVRAKGETSSTVPGVLSATASVRSTTPAFSLGGGMEGRLVRSLLGGIDFRYRIYRLNKDKFGTADGKAFTFSFRLGWLFGA